MNEKLMHFTDLSLYSNLEYKGLVALKEDGTLRLYGTVVSI